MATSEKLIIAQLIGAARRYQFCGQRDDPRAQTAGYRRSAFQLERLPEP